MEVACLFCMTSIPRYFILNDNDSFHITWQIHNKSNYFKDEVYKRKYYELMFENKKTYNLKIFSYCIMDTHIHFTGFSENKVKVSRFMKKVNSCFARFYNHREGKRGQVCMDRFKSPVIHTDQDMLNVMRYIDLNPVKAFMKKHPEDYKYSSYRHYAYGEKDPLLDDCPAYLGLGATDLERQKKYREMVDELLANKELKDEELFVTKLFIGSPEWVIKKYTELKRMIKAKKIKPSNNRETKKRK